MFRKVLIANRGEIALRIIFACKELGIQTVAVYSEADRHALHVRFADEAICIGPAKSAESYLNIPGVISAAEVTNADAIHPGYGFLSENPHFAQVCAECGIKFIGPSAESIRTMGTRPGRGARCRAWALPFFRAVRTHSSTWTTRSRWPWKSVFPVIVKATAGGGGRGMRVVYDKAEFATAFETARSEAEASFGVADCYLEKFADKARHIEFQVLADEYGNAIHLGERECSIQRRHQKLVEEAPSVVMTEELRARVGAAVVDAVLELGYTNVGTIEFLVDGDLNFYSWK